MIKNLTLAGEGAIQMLIFYPKVLERMLDIANEQMDDVEEYDFNWSLDGLSHYQPFRLNKSRGNLIITEIKPTHSRIIRSKPKTRRKVSRRRVK